MDFKKLAGTLLSSDSINGLSTATGASASDVKKVLTNALPSLLNGAKAQAKDKETTESFTNALTQHAKDDTKDLTSFLSNVDMKDGAKIISHLLGSEKNTAIKDIAKKSGVSQKNTTSILSAIGPLLMSLLGQQTQEEESASPLEGLLGTLMENVDMGSVLMGLLGSSSVSENESHDKKKKKKKKKEESDNLLSGLMNLLK